MADGEVLAVLGPNGAGQVHAAAGARRAAAARRGRVVVDGEVWDDDDASVPPHRRRLGMVFQDALLFPHLSVADNVAFGLRTRGVRRTRGARGRRRPGWPGSGWTGSAAGGPAQLSGGQAQRAALARALVGEPALLLLDEPLSALDARTRLTVRAELRRHLAEFGGSTVLVTHDPVDAMALADRVVVVEEGRVVQAGTPGRGEPAPAHRLRRPAGRALAAARHRRRARRCGWTAAARWRSPRRSSGPVFAAVRPESVALYLARPEGSPRNVWPLRLAGAVPHGTTVRCELAGAVPLVADVTATAFAELGLAPGGEVWAAVKASEVAVYAR